MLERSLSISHKAGGEEGGEGGRGGFILVHFALEGMCNNDPADLFTSSISAFSQAQRTHLRHGW